VNHQNKRTGGGTYYEGKKTHTLSTLRAGGDARNGGEKGGFLSPIPQFQQKLVVTPGVRSSYCSGEGAEVASFGRGKYKKGGTTLNKR